MNSKEKYLIKNMGILTISNFASKILVFLLVPLYTTVLSTAEYGTYDLVISTISLIMPLVTLNIIDAVMRFLMDKTCDQRQVATIGAKYVSISVVAVAMVLFVFNQLNIWTNIEGLEIYIFFYYLFYSFNQYFIQLAKGLEKIREMGIAGVLGTVVMIASNLFFLLVMRLGLRGFFVANILAQAVPVLYYFLSIRCWNYFTKEKIDKKLKAEMLIYCVPLIVTVVGWWVNSGSDRYVVTFFCGVASNGILSVAYKIPSVLNILQGIFIQAWQISAIKEYGGEDTAQFYGKTFSTVNLLMCAACSWLIILTRPIANILYAKDFYQAWQYVPFLLISSVLNCASGLLGSILSAKKNSKAMMWSAIIGAGANIIMNIAFVYFIGIQGATIATMICSYIIYAVRKRAVGKDIHIEGYRIILITWILLCIQAIIEVSALSWIYEIIIMAVLLVINISGIKSVIEAGLKQLKHLRDN